jgi:phosphate transport system substrate-binding protein
LCALATGFISLGGAAEQDKEVNSVTVKGSDTMTPLVTAWAEEFGKTHQSVSVSVTGGGSGTGIAALLNGTTTIAMASREIGEKETKDAAGKSIKPTATIVANDGIPAIVNPKNQIGALTLEQIRKIFTGEITNWKEVGGPDQPIYIFSRESSSGTCVFFQEHVLQKKDYSPKTRFLPTHSAIIQEVSSNPLAIGYAGLGHATAAKGRIKVLKVKKDEKSEAVAPSIETVNNGTYSIARPLYFYTNNDPRGSAKAFVDFCLSPEGQKIVEEQGLVPLKK